jgi:rod shape-determining protein MreC
LSNDRQTQTDYFAPVRRAITVILLLGLFGLFVLWRIDSPRVEKFRALVIDTFVPSFEWMLRPMTSVVKLAQDYQSYEKLLEQNKELRRELQQMKSWKEAALQLEQENARLLDLNQLRVDSKLTHVSGIVVADSGSPFRQSVLLNIGSKDGIQDGWAAMDGLGLVGRISGVGSSTSRVILLTDNASQIPVTIQPSGQQAILMGDNSYAPPVEFIENVDLVRPGDRIVTSGRGGVLPTGLLIRVPEGAAGLWYRKNR